MIQTRDTIIESHTSANPIPTKLSLFCRLLRFVHTCRIFVVKKPGTDDALVFDDI